MRKAFACIQPKANGGEQRGNVRSTIMFPVSSLSAEGEDVRTEKSAGPKSKTNVMCDGRRLRKCWREVRLRKFGGISM